FAPVLVSPVEEKGTVNVWAISDRRTDTPARLTVRLLGFSGHQIWRGDQDITLTANASRVYSTFRRDEMLAGADPRRAVPVAALSHRAGKRLPPNLLYFGKTKDLALPKPGFTLDVEPRADGTFAVKVATQSLARNVYLTTGEGMKALAGSFDDNFF